MKNLTDFPKMLETDLDSGLLIRMLFESVQPKMLKIKLFALYKIFKKKN